MKSWTDPGDHGVVTLPLNGAPSRIRRSSGIFHSLTPFVFHCQKTWSTCVSSTTPATSHRPSVTTSTSVARIGPDVRMGEAIRTRSRALPMCFATRCERASPCSGQNQGRTRIPSTSSGRGSTAPVVSTRPVSHSCLNSSAYAYAISFESTVTMTFSCRDQESSVQFVEPVHTDVPSRTTNLWCMRSGIPATPRVVIGRASIASGVASGGGGTGIGPGWSTLYRSRTSTPRWTASSSAARTSAPPSVSKRTS